MKYLVRIDDFPWNQYHQKDENLLLFKKFFQVLSKYDIKILLGVIPAYCTKYDLDYLRTLKNVEVAIHGYDHSGKSYEEGEFNTVSLEEKQRRISDSINILKDFKVRSFIPPYNYFDSELIQILINHSIRFIFGLENYEPLRIYGVHYYPTSKINYGHSYELLSNWEKLDRSCNVNLITLHCTWEYGDNTFCFDDGNLDRLCQKLSGNTTTIDELLESTLPEYSNLPIATRLSYDWILNKVGSGYKVLDVGSKSSLLPSLICMKGNKITSIDTDNIVMERQYRYMQLYSISYDVRIMDARKLQFQDSSFDVVTSAHSIQHSLDDDIKIVKEIYRILKPGGRLLLVSSFTMNESYHWTDRKDPQRVNCMEDIVRRFISPNHFQLVSIDFYSYDYGKNVGNWSTVSTANAVCLELMK